ncbi:MAG: hypothetical protein ACJ786_02645 [Catenulispora sp.]
MAVPRWWSYARLLFKWQLMLAIWTTVALTVGLAIHDGGVGVLAGAVAAIGVPYVIVWPAMRISARRRGVPIRLQWPSG